MRLVGTVIGYGRGQDNKATQVSQVQRIAACSSKLLYVQRLQYRAGGEGGDVEKMGREMECCHGNRGP